MLLLLLLMMLLLYCSAALTNAAATLAADTLVQQTGNHYMSNFIWPSFQLPPVCAENVYRLVSLQATEIILEIKNGRNIWIPLILMMNFLSDYPLLNHILPLLNPNSTLKGVVAILIVFSNNIFHRFFQEMSLGIWPSYLRHVFAHVLYGFSRTSPSGWTKWNCPRTEFSSFSYLGLETYN